MYCTLKSAPVILQKGCGGLPGRGSGYEAGYAGFKESMRAKTRLLAFWECRRVSSLLGVESSPSDPFKLQVGAYSSPSSVRSLVLLVSPAAGRLPPDPSDIVVGEEETGTHALVIPTRGCDSRVPL